MIEDLIKDLTSAVVSLTVAINNASSEVNDAADANVEEAVDDEGVAETESLPKRVRRSRKVADTTVTVSCTTESIPAQFAVPEVEDEKVVILNIDDVRKVINEVSVKLEPVHGPDNTRAMLTGVVASFGVAVSSEIPAAAFSEAIARFRALTDIKAETPSQPVALGI